MSAKERENWIVLDDFTAGIHDSYHAASGTLGEGDPARDGAAQIDETWGCYGHPRGGLAPLPGLSSDSRTVTVSRTKLGTDAGAVTIDTGASYYPRILTTQIMSPVFQADDEVTPDTSSTILTTPDLLLFGIQAKVDSSTNRETLFYIWKAGHVGSVDATDLVAHHFNADKVGAADDFGWVASALGRVEYASFYQPVFAFIAARRSQDDAHHYPDIVGATGSMTDTFDSTSFPGVGTPYRYFSHQGRLVAIVGGAVGVGPVVGDEVVLMPGDYFEYSDVDDVTVLAQSGVLFWEENFSGYGVAHSVNASELFLVKNHGGGVVVRGDIDNPDVSAMPGIPSSRGIACIGTVTPQGFVYGTRDGVFLWNGGDTAECISKQFDGYFWENTQTQAFRIGQPRGKFAYNYPYVFAPNNFVLDTRTGGWFRLRPDTSQSGFSGNRCYAYYEISAASNGMYAIPASCYDTSGTNIPLFDHYDLTSEATHFSWKSQPLVRTRGRNLLFRTIRLTYQGTGTITVSLEGIGGETKTIAFQGLASDVRPVTLEEPVYLYAQDVIVTVASAGSGSGAAPRVLRLQFGYDERSGVTGSPS